MYNYNNNNNNNSRIYQTFIARGENDCLWVKSSPLPISVNGFIGAQPHLFVCCLWLFSSYNDRVK